MFTWLFQKVCTPLTSNTFLSGIVSMKKTLDMLIFKSCTHQLFKEQPLQSSLFIYWLWQHICIDFVINFFFKLIYDKSAKFKEKIKIKRTHFLLFIFFMIISILKFYWFLVCLICIYYLPFKWLTLNPVFDVGIWTNTS